MGLKKNSHGKLIEASSFRYRLFTFIKKYMKIFGYEKVDY